MGCLLLAVDVLAVFADAPAGERVPWARRKRAALTVLDSHDGETEDRTVRDEVDAGARRAPLSVQEARRLGLRPRMDTQPTWPAEPASPQVTSGPSFARALQQLCPTPRDRTRLSSLVLRFGDHFDVDPFLLGALVYHQSRCNPTHADGYGVGLARIAPGMFQGGMHGGAYYFGLPDGRGRFARAALPVPAFPFSRASLRSPEANVYFAAALLRVLSQQCPAIDAPFRSAPHRHAVSHFVWGDVVQSSLPEDHILTARRRLLHYYAPLTRHPRGLLGTTPLSSPLDGAPRIVIGVMGDRRQGGRRHAGIDLAAGEEEPVRAMASGVVTFAGADLRSRGLQPIEPEQLSRLRVRRMGPRGLFVRIRHDEGFESLYSHLSEYYVRVGDRVAGGQELGRVGRTGIHTSDAHLHLGLFLDGRAIDPLAPLSPYVVRLRDGDHSARPRRAAHLAERARPRRR